MALKITIGLLILILLLAMVFAIPYFEKTWAVIFFFLGYIVLAWAVLNAIRKKEN